MKVQITARKCEVADEIRERAKVLADRWPRFDRTAQGIRLVFEVQGAHHSVEAVIARARRDPVVATGEGRDFRIALDELDGRVSRILRRDNQRRKDHKPRHPLPQPE